MHVTEMLITGYDGDEAVFAVNLAAAENEENDDEAFEAIWAILEKLSRVPASVSS